MSCIDLALGNLGKILLVILVFKGLGKKIMILLITGWSLDWGNCSVRFAAYFWQHCLGNLHLNSVILFRLKLLNEQTASLSDKLKLAIEETLSADERALRLEEILKEEEKSVEVRCFPWFLEMRSRVYLQALYFKMVSLILKFSVKMRWKYWYDM